MEGITEGHNYRIEKDGDFGARFVQSA